MLLQGCRQGAEVAEGAVALLPHQKKGEKREREEEERKKEVREKRNQK